MKTMSTQRLRLFLFVLLSVPLFNLTARAQKETPAAKCAGFTAKITNGSVLNLCPGTSIDLMASPLESGYRYQWQIQTTAGGPFTNITGATGSSHNTSTLAAYRVVINTGSCVDTSGITSVIRLNVAGGTLISASNAPICLGEPGGLIEGDQVAGADLGIVTYSWEYSEDNATWTTIKDATNNSYTVGPLFKTTSYRRVATDNCGNKAYSNTIVLTSTPTLVAGTLSPMTQTINAGQTPAPITSATPASGGSNNYAYQWQSSVFERGTFFDIPGATSASYSPGALNQTMYYRRVVTDTRCLNTVISELAIVFVRNGILNPGSFTAGASCFFPGNPAATLTTQYEPSGGVPPYTVEWQSSTDNVNFTSIPGANGSRLEPGILTATTYFRKKVTDASGTVAYTGSERIEMITSPLTGGTVQATSNVACLGSAPAIIKSTASPTGYAGLGYQWQYKTASTNGWIDIKGQDREGLIPEPITEKTIFRRVAIDRCGSSERMAYSNEVEIDIRPALVAGDIEPTSQDIRMGETPRPLNSVAGPSGGTGSYTLSWETAALAVGPWSTIASVSTPGYQPPTVNQTTYYRRVVVDNNCLATKYTYTVEVYLKKDTVNPCNFVMKLKAGLVDAPFITCAGTAPGTIRSVLDACSGTNVSYQWEVLENGKWTTIAGATSASYTPGAISSNMTYRRKATDNCGNSGYSNSVEIYVYPPIEPGVIGNEKQTVCVNAKPEKISLLTNCHYTDGTVTYQWQSATSANGPWTNINGATSRDYTPAPGANTMYYRLQVNSTTCSFVAYTNIASVVVNGFCRNAATNSGVTAASREMTVFPNPVTGNVIAVKLATQGKVNVRLQNAAGKSIPVAVTQVANGQMKIAFTRMPPRGMYILTILDDKGTQTSKVLVQ